MKNYRKPSLTVVDVYGEERIASCESRAYAVDDTPSQALIDQLLNDPMNYDVIDVCHFEFKVNQTIS